MLPWRSLSILVLTISLFSSHVAPNISGLIDRALQALVGALRELPDGLPTQDRRLKGLVTTCSTYTSSTSGVSRGVPLSGCMRQFLDFKMVWQLWATNKLVPRLRINADTHDAAAREPKSSFEP